MASKKFPLVLIILTMIFTVFSVYGADPGTNEDPLVAKSYVDDIVEQIMDKIDSLDLNSTIAGTDEDTEYQKYKDDIIAEVKEAIKDEIGAEIEGIRQTVTELENKGTEEPVTTENEVSYTTYQPVFASVGQIVLGGEGSEFILRSGKADGYITGVDGIVNATTGGEVNHGSKVPLNNLLLVPREDGRGFKMTEAGWFMIKGKYTIQ